VRSPQESPVVEPVTVTKEVKAPKQKVEKAKAVEVVDPVTVTKEVKEPKEPKAKVQKVKEVEVVDPVTVTKEVKEPKAKKVVRTHAFPLGLAFASSQQSALNCAFKVIKSFNWAALHCS
jgi:hypothetical protein